MIKNQKFSKLKLFLQVMKILGIIPARYGSNRFPGKPLIDIKGKSMIQWVYERSAEVIDYLIVATDDIRIFDEVKRFNGKVVMTSKLHKTGTDRCAEAYKSYKDESGINFDIVINIQGDEPFVHKEHLKKVISNFDNESTQISTLIKQIKDKEDIFNPNLPKVLIDIENFAIYFSRSSIPFIRDCEKDIWHIKHTFYKHIGIYAYKTEVLEEITKLSQSSLELAESLEQNRWIENGYKIKVAETEKENFAIDTEDDLKKFLLNFSSGMET
jgi:3-deoxy-manno-octulosonate cytidylyltransferase (CMP-KDO synthetase)